MIFKTNYPRYSVTFTVLLNVIIYLLMRTGVSATQCKCVATGPNSGSLPVFIYNQWL